MRYWVGQRILFQVHGKSSRSSFKAEELARLEKVFNVSANQRRKNNEAWQKSKYIYRWNCFTRWPRHRKESPTCLSLLFAIIVFNSDVYTRLQKKMIYFKLRAKTNIKASVTCYVPFKLGIAVIGAFWSPTLTFALSIGCVEPMLKWSTEPFVSWWAVTLPLHI